MVIPSQESAKKRNERKEDKDNEEMYSSKNDLQMKTRSMRAIMLVYNKYSEKRDRETENSEQDENGVNSS